MEPFIDYYKILGVQSNATIHEIKSAYRQLAKKYHPDVCKDSNAHERFVLINEAYLILSNEQARNQYDTIFEYHFKTQQQKAEEPINNDKKKEFDEFKSTQEKAKQKAEHLSKISLKELLKILDEATKDAGQQIINILLFVLGGFLVYIFSDIFFVKNPNYAISIICVILSLPIFWFLARRKF